MPPGSHPTARDVACIVNNLNAASLVLTTEAWRLTEGRAGSFVVGGEHSEYKDRGRVVQTGSSDE